MELKTLGAVANLIAMTVYACGAGWHGYQRRRDHWTRGSWIGLGLVGVAGIALLGLALGITLAVDNHEAWVGAPRSDTRSGYALLAMGSMIGGVLLLAGSLGWFALGEPTHQFPLVGAIRRESTEPSLLKSAERTPVKEGGSSA